MITCPSCTAEIDDASRYCPSCGVSLESVGGPTETSPPASARRPVAPATSSDSIDQSRFAPGTMLTDRYRIVGLLGKGGMGEVYRADDLKLRQSVALKFLPTALSKNAQRLERFHHEVRVARQVSHPNVCRVYDVSEADGQQFISMEFVDGEDLASLLRRMGKPSTEKAVEIARQLCAGLAAAHDRGVLHRDLKPHNVMIDGRGKVRVTDFGLAGFVEELAGADVGAGTPAYMAPEQLEGREVSVKSDIYSLGLVLYELFTGKRLFEGMTREQVGRLQSTTPASVSDLTDGVDPAVERVIRRCLEHDPAARPSSALAVAAALPGADPLAAALAAGETPSPELVAVAGESGSVSMRTGLILLGSFFGVLIVYAGFVTYVSRKLNRSAEKAPIVLADDARELIRSLGHVNPPTDSAYGLERFNAYQMGFWYRESQSRLVPAFPMGVVTRTDPAPNVPGMSGAIVDRKGKLLELTVVAAHAGTVTPAPNDDDPEGTFDLVIAAAGLNRAAMKPVPPTATPAVGCDRLYAWEEVDADDDGSRVRVEAGSLYGRPVYFKLLPAEAGRLPMSISTESTGWLGQVLIAIVPTVMIVILIASAAFARRNLRLGRGDRRGATRLGIAIFAATAVSRFLVADHWGAGVQVYMTVIQILGFALFSGAYGTMLYLALEPYVRRAWPERIVSITRLLSGRFLDPLIGRDLVIGSLIGMSANLGFSICGILGSIFGWPRGVYWQADMANARLSMRHTLGALSGGVGADAAAALWMLFLLVVALAVLRRRNLAALGVIIVLSLFICGWPSGGHIGTVLMIGAVWTAYISTALLRFGLLTLMTAVFTHRVGTYFYPTFDFGVWDVGNIWFANAVLIALAVFGFMTATRGQTLLREEIFDSVPGPKS